MAQFDFGVIDPTTTSGTDLASLLGSFRDALNTNHSGTSRPTYIVANMLWVEDVSATVKRVNIYDGNDDISLGTYNTDTNVCSPAAPTDVDITANNLTATQQVRFSGNIDASVTGTVNNWAPTNLANAFQINATTSTSATITGIDGGVDGRLLLIITTTGGITLAHDNAGSLANARIEISGERDLLLNRGDSVLLRWEATTSDWRTVSMIRSSMLPNSYIDGLFLSNSAGELAHDLSVSTGSCKSDDGTADIIVSTGVSNVPMDVAFSEPAGGGMVSGDTLPTSGTIHVFVIDGPGNTPKLLGSSSAGSGLTPTLPTGYTISRRIASIPTDASANILRFQQLGQRYFELAETIEAAAAANFGTDVTLDVGTPSQIAVLAKLQFALVIISGPQEAGGRILSRPALSALAPTGNTRSDLITDSPGRTASQVSAIADTLSRVQVQVSLSNVNIFVYVNLIGWEEVQ